MPSSTTKTTNTNSSVYVQESNGIELWKTWKTSRQRKLNHEKKEGGTTSMSTSTPAPRQIYQAPIDRGRANGKTISLKLVKVELSNLGMVISFNPDDREYRVNFKGGEEVTAYYTNDLADAYGTGKLMSKAKNSPPQPKVE